MKIFCADLSRKSVVEKRKFILGAFEGTFGITEAAVNNEEYSSAEDGVLSDECDMFNQLLSQASGSLAEPEDKREAQNYVKNKPTRKTKRRKGK